MRERKINREEVEEVEREMATNSCFGKIMEEGDEPGFFKILRKEEQSSETMRGIPRNFIKSISEKEFSAKMILKLPWGSSWPIKICQNPRFYYMEKNGWEQFLKGNALGGDEFLTFTHKGNLCVSVNIFQINGKEMLRPRKSATIASSSGLNKGDQRKNIYKDVKKEPSNPVPKTAETTGGRLRKKRVLILEKKKTEVTEKSKKKKVPEFSLIITKSYLNFLGIPKMFMEMHMPKETSWFKIHHPKEGKKSWEVKHMVIGAQSRFSAGWIGLVKELGLEVRDVCTFKLIKPTEMIIKVSKGE